MSTTSAMKRVRLTRDARRVATAATLLGALAGYGGAAQAIQTMHDHVDSGGTVDLNGYASNYGAANNCASDPAQVEILVPPANGRTQVTLEHQLAPNSVDGATAPRECDGAVKNVSMLYYSARPGFVGEDQVTVRVTFPGGRQYDYLFIVTVGGGSAKAAASNAAQTVTAPDGDATANSAPASANMGDFLSGVAGSGTPAAATRAAPAPARPATTTNAGDFMAQAAARGVPAVPPGAATRDAGRVATPMAIKRAAPVTRSPSPSVRQQLAPPANNGPSLM